MPQAEGQPQRRRPAAPGPSIFPVKQVMLQIRKQFIPTSAVCCWLKPEGPEPETVPVPVGGRARH